MKVEPAWRSFLLRANMAVIRAGQASARRGKRGKYQNLKRISHDRQDSIRRCAAIRDVVYYQSAVRQSSGEHERWRFRARGGECRLRGHWQSADGVAIKRAPGASLAERAPRWGRGFARRRRLRDGRGKARLWS